MKYATVVIPHAYSPRWLQIVVSSLLATKNDRDFDILVVDNSYGHPSIEAITKTRLIEKVKVIPPRDLKHSGHQLGLDHAIDFVETPYFFATETDVKFLRDGWLDWYAGFVKDNYVAMVGWYWELAGKDDSRHYINPSATLYSTRILKQLKQECLNNKDMMVCYGRPNNHKRIDLAKDYPYTAGKFIPEGNWGPFSECRGFGNVYLFPRDHWVPEPGNWIYNRCSMQWETVKVPGAFVANELVDQAPSVPYKYNYYGNNDSEAYIRHYWGGTVSHNFDKQDTISHWEAACVEYWLRREYWLWENTVPKDVQQISIEKGLVRQFNQELKIARTKGAC